MGFGKGNGTVRAREKKLRALDAANDIRYRGPLSYRSFRILGWVCVALSQVAAMQSLKVRLDPTLADVLSSSTTVLKLVSNMALPLFLIANFAVILNAGEGYDRQLVRFGGTAFAVGVGSAFVYRRYIVGALSALTQDRQAVQASFETAFRSSDGPGYFSYNLFIDLFLCTLLMFFLNYRPKRLFTGKRLRVFRAFAALPIAYEIVSILLKVLAVNGKVKLPFIIFPFLTVKPPMTFAVFIVLAFFIKNRERHFLKNGKTHEDYRQFLETNRNSFQFSRFTARILAVAGILDIVAIFVVLAVLQSKNPGVELSFEYFSSYLDALGVGESAMLLLMAPLMLLFSYTRIPKNKSLDAFIPIVGMSLIALVYVEGFYQLLLMVPDLLASGKLLGLDTLGSLVEAAGPTVGP